MTSGKPLISHEIVDPTRTSSRLYHFTLPNGEHAYIDITIVPKEFSINQPHAKKPTREQTLQAITAAASTDITNFIK